MANGQQWQDSAPPVGWQDSGPPPGTGEDKASFGKRYLASSGFEGLVNLAKNLPQNWSDLFSMAAGPAKEAASSAIAPAKHLGDMIDAYKSGDKDTLVSSAGRFLDSFIPGTGNAQDVSQNTIKDVQNKNYAGIAGTAAGLGTQLALTASALREPVAAASKTPGLAERMYQSALKPSTTLPTSKVASMVKTGLEEGIPVSPSGVEKIGALIDDLNDKVATEIKGSGVTVNKYAVASRLADTAKEFSQQVTPTKDLNAIAKSGNEFLREQPVEIPAEQAQAIKTGTYQQIKKSYGKLSNATIESQKALARGIKEELASQIPEIGDLNERESRLIGLDKALERAVGRTENYQMVGIGTPIVAGAAGAVAKRSAVGLVAGAVKAIIDDPMVKSKLAIAMSRHGGNISSAASRIAAYSEALGRFSSAGAGGDQSSGGQP